MRSKRAGTSPSAWGADETTSRLSGTASTAEDLRLCPEPEYPLSSECEAALAATYASVDGRLLAQWESPQGSQPLSVGLGADALHYTANGVAQRCDMTVSQRFQGFRDPGGIVSGDWFYFSRIACTAPQPRLMTYARIFYGSGNVSSTTLQQCKTPENGACSSIQSSGGWICSFCNGPWYTTGYFELTLDPSWLVTRIPPECSHIVVSNTFRCQFNTPTSHIA